ncbi:effector-associated domain EAD1-containing protein [Halomicronema sp. CCY15110]|uniref:effector-associated domain EAD1-containing protein n=1 Tax=Halomicronema sp. CCY15110 TaxID=2767773 RepID=UPI00195043D6|nr:effector-associated domain EAD1-containing protein [Halomicronema sp. CCY15110]
MKLRFDQLKELYEAILDGCSEGDLRQIAYFGLGFSLEEKAGGKNFSDTVFDLVVHCEKNGLLETLICSVYEKNSNNSKIKSFYELHLQFQSEELEKESASTFREGTYQFPKVGDFDLIGLMDDVKQKLLKSEFNTGLIGIAIPCNSEEFRLAFCERLRQRLDSMNKDRGKSKKINAKKLDPILSADDIAKVIQRECKGHLSKKRDVIYCIRISSNLENAEYANRFWQALDREFEDFNFESRLVIFMNGENKPIFPDSSLRFPSPEFNRDHIWNWIAPIKSSSNWGEFFWEDVWMDCMKEKCMHPSDEDLKIDIVYRFLETTIQLLGQGPSDKDDFIDELRYRVSA